MKDFLRRIKLLDYSTINIDIEKTEFVNTLRKHVDIEELSFISNAFEAFSSSKNEYRGRISYDHFKIKRRRRFFDFNISMAIATGSFKQKNETLVIETEINSFSNMMIPFYMFLIIFYLIFIGIFLFIDDLPVATLLVFIPFMIIHFCFMAGIPYFLMRRSTKKLKYELERDLYFITKK